MATEGIRRAALAVIAIFAAHTFSVLLTEPLRPVSRARSTQPIAMAGAQKKVDARADDGGSSASFDPVEHPSTTADRSGTKGARASDGRATEGLSLAAYEGLGSWVDLFDRSPWRNPSWTVRKMDARGVRTIYLQTATYGSPASVVYPKKVAEFIASAHRRNMTVVGWSVPSFTNPKKDFRRARAGALFKTRKGERFDSFALDIEANIVNSIWLRNHRLIELSDQIRKAVGKNYPLGAIIPDSHSRYWPDFPYKQIAKRYQVMIPMAYSTFTTHGYKGVRDYTAANIKTIRRKTGDPKTPVHVIGGIADNVGVPAARGFIKAIKKHRAVGASLYDFPITSEKTWKELSAVPRPGG